MINTRMIFIAALLCGAVSLPAFAQGTSNSNADVSGTVLNAPNGTVTSGDKGSLAASPPTAGGVVGPAQTLGTGTMATANSSARHRRSHKTTTTVVPPA